MSGAFPYVIRLKQGATLALDVLVEDDNGAPVDLTGATVTLLIADPFGNTVATPAVTPGAEMGWGTIVADSSPFPYGSLPCQVQVVAAGVTTISDTFDIVVERGVGA